MSYVSTLDLRAGAATKQEPSLSTPRCPRSIPEFRNASPVRQMPIQDMILSLPVVGAQLWSIWASVLKVELLVLGIDPLLGYLDLTWIMAAWALCSWGSAIL